MNEQDKKDLKIAIVLLIILISSYLVLATIIANIANENNLQYILDTVMPIINILYMIVFGLAIFFFAFFVFVQYRLRGQTNVNA